MEIISVIETLLPSSISIKFVIKYYATIVNSNFNYI